MRIDKYLKVTRLIKRRQVGKEACDIGRVEINGKTVKPSKEVAVGDIVTVIFGEKRISVRVLALSQSTKKADAQDMYEVIE